MDQIGDLLELSRSWNGHGNGYEFSGHIANIQIKHQLLPTSLKATFPLKLAVNGVIGSLAKDERLKSLHTILRRQYEKEPDEVTLGSIAQEVTAVLRDYDKDKKSKSICKEEDPVASLTSFNFAKTKKNLNFESSVEPFKRSRIDSRDSMN